MVVVGGMKSSRNADRKAEKKDTRDDAAAKDEQYLCQPERGGGHIGCPTDCAQYPVDSRSTL